MAEERCGFCDEHNLRALKIDQNCKAIEKVSTKVERIDDEIHGGGTSRDGIYTQLALISQDVTTIKKTLDACVKKGDIIWLNRLVWGTTSTLVFWVMKEILVGTFIK